MFESVTQILEQLTWIPLSKRRENSHLILFYRFINNLAVVPHSCREDHNLVITWPNDVTQKWQQFG